MYTTALVITLSISGISAIIFMAFLFLSYRSGFIRLLIKLTEVNTLAFRLISYKARWEAMRAIFYGNRVIPVYKPFDAELV